jgi:hypothetical protein
VFHTPAASRYTASRVEPVELAAYWGYSGNTTMRSQPRSRSAVRPARIEGLP